MVTTEEILLLRLKDLTITKRYRSGHLMNLCRMTCNYVFFFKALNVMIMSKISDQILTAAIVRVVVGGVGVYSVIP